MDKLEQIREAISRLTQLSADELASTKALIAEAAKDVDVDGDNSPEAVAALTELADFLDNIEAQEQALATAAAEAEQAKAAARERIAKINGKTDEEEVPEGDEGAPEGEPEGAEGEAAPELVTASGRRAGTSISKMAANRSPGGTVRVPGAVPNRTALVASSQMEGLDKGHVIADRWELAESMFATLERMSPNDKPKGRVVLASADWRDQYPDERRLHTQNGEMLTPRDAKVMDAVTHPTALVATGGICSPVNVDYSMGTWAVPDRPLRDGLPAFQASRGGIIYRTPFDISDITTATTIWTEATDADPAGATKPVQALACPSNTTTYVAAVSTRLGFGNMQSRFDPESIANFTDVAIAQAAQEAEVNLLTQIAASAVADITTAQLLGAARGFLTTLDSVKAAYKDIHRLGDAQVLTIILPRWVRDLIRADRVQELAHDGQSVDPLALSDDYIDSLFNVRNVKPIWMLDGLPQNGGTYPKQGFVPFTASAALQNFPTKLVWHLFVEGTIQFLDGGRLDLGVVRDSTLDATNDFETFVETFEGIANRGFSSGALQLVTTVCANGQSSATATVSSCL
jgi:hypothetical protein